MNQTLHIVKFVISPLLRHDLDPNAAIKVPGMAYQPPLIGFKQLLNFGAYSIPDIGGWLFIGAGVLMVAAYFKDRIKSKV